MTTETETGHDPWRISHLRGDVQVNVQSDSQMICNTLHGRDEEHAALIVHAVNAIKTAAQRLGLDPAVLAERLAKGGIAELVEAARDQEESSYDASDWDRVDRRDAASKRVLAALTPFAKE
jgi:hypothetical protein